VAKSFRCKLVTPAAALLDDKVTYASIPAYDGLMGIESSHAPMLVKLGMGELRLDMADDAKLGKGGSRSYAVSGGFMKIANDELTILAEQAAPAETISASEAEAELSKLSGTNAQTPAAAEALRQQRAFARVKVNLAKSGKGI
jgi:F-type H+-transporting ATPase subunit epsilon